MRASVLLVLLFWAAAGLAQTMYKCVDDQRRLTYSNITCEKQGLKDAGPVADRVTSMPFTEPPKPTKPGALPTVKLPLPADDAEAGRDRPLVRPVNPLIEKLMK